MQRDLALQPTVAQTVLPAAYAYARIAPDAEHAQHMPSHVFLKLGLWDGERAGALLLATRRPGEAEREYAQALRLTPNRSLALLGLARARLASGDSVGAAAYRRLVTNWRGADSDLPALGEVRRGATVRSGSRRASAVKSARRHGAAERIAESRSDQRSSASSMPTLSRINEGGRCSWPGMPARRSIVDSTAPRLVA